MKLPFPFNKASDVRADTEGSISLVDVRGKALAQIPMTTAFELSPKAECYGHGSHGFGPGDGSGFGYGDRYGSGFGSGDGSGKSK